MILILKTSDSEHYSSLLPDLLLPPPQMKENLNKERDKACHNFLYTDLQFLLTNTVPQKSYGAGLGSQLRTLEW